MRIRGLDGVRGLAILLVLIAHATGVLMAGVVGVLIFFVLSGYLITSILVAEFDRTGRVRFAAFYLRRALRLLPALVVLLALLLATPWWPALGVDVDEAVRGAVIGLLYLTDFTLGFQLDNPPPIAHLWSLAVEEQFYLLWPAGLLVLLRATAPQRLSWLRRIVVGAVLLRLLTMIVAGPLNLFFYALPTIWADTLLVGATAAIIRRDQPQTWRRWAALAVTPQATWVAVAVLALGSVLAPAYWWPLTYAVGLPVLALASIVLIIGVVSGAQTLPHRVLDWPVAGWLGDHSYSLYLYNSFCILLLQRVIGAGLWQRVAGLLVAIVLAILSRRFVEQPFLRLKTRLAQAASTP